MGLEPIRLSTHAPQTCLSAYSSTLASALFSSLMFYPFPDCFTIITDNKTFVKPFLKKNSDFF